MTSYIGRGWVFVLLTLSLIVLISSFSIALQQKPTDREGQEGLKTVREKLLLDRGWKFHFGDASNLKEDFDFGLGATFAKAGEAVGAVQPNFNDSTWRTVDLPHDWAVDLDFVRVKDNDVISHGYKPVGRQFPKSTIGWYRRALFIPKEDESRRLMVKFDGVFRDCIVWLNGHYLGNNLSGYSEFGYDVTDYVRYGEKNVVVVRVDVSQYEGWFYEGAGIYRHTWLIKTEPVHVPEYGVFVHTDMSKGAADVHAETDIMNKSETGASCELLTLILDERGKSVATSTSREISLQGAERKTVRQDINVSSPHLWSLESPYLYKLVSIVKSRGATEDSLATTFGIRTVRLDKDKGFFLNDKPVKIKGTCNHQDHAGVGSALPDRLQYLQNRTPKRDGMQRVPHEPQSADK